MSKHTQSRSHVSVFCSLSFRSPSPYKGVRQLAEATSTAATLLTKATYACSLPLPWRIQSESCKRPQAELLTSSDRFRLPPKPAACSKLGMRRSCHSTHCHNLDHRDMQPLKPTQNAKCSKTTHMPWQTRKLQDPLSDSITHLLSL